MLSIDEFEHLECALADLQRTNVRLHALVEFGVETGLTLDELARLGEHPTGAMNALRQRAFRLRRGGDIVTVCLSDRAYAHIHWLALPRRSDLVDLRIEWAIAMKIRDAPVDLDEAIVELHRIRAILRTHANDDEVPF